MLGLPTSAGAEPGASTQEVPDDDRSPTDGTLVDVSSLSGSAVSLALDELHDKVADQLDRLKAEEKKITQAIDKLAAADEAIAELQFAIEDRTADSDEIVIDAFINPPESSALDVLGADTTLDATVTQALLDLEADQSARALNAPQRDLRRLRAAQAEQRKAREAAETARADHEAALADLDSAMSEEAQFAAAVQAALDEGAKAPLPTDPDELAAFLARQADLMAALGRAKSEKAAEDARRAAEAERQRRIAAGIMFCPVAGPNHFTDTWGAARSGGRSHKGVDMLAAYGTPTVAPFGGRVVHRGSSLGGLSWYVYADNGNMYYGTHLSGYANVGLAHVEAGTVIGYVGDSGNARGTPHLHFEVHPGGGAAVNPYSYVRQVC
jgi:murein DD-endopeptidase MepM/ murein hydrolase activator NlpD